MFGIIVGIVGIVVIAALAVGFEKFDDSFLDYDP